MKVKNILTSISLVCASSMGFATTNQASFSEISPKNVVVHKVTTDKKSDSYIYRPSAMNLVSGSKVNSVWFPLPVQNIMQPPGQTNVSFKLLDHNRALNFTVFGGVTSNIQFVVIFGNGHPPITLTFHVSDNIPGKIISIPLTMTGVQDSTKSFGSTSEYDQMIIDINKSFTNNKLGDFWTITKEIKHPYSPFKQFRLSDFKSYSSTNYTMNQWTLCNTRPNINIEESEFYNPNKNIVSITLTKHWLYNVGTCSKLLVLIQKTVKHNSKDNNGLLSPVGGA